MKEEAESMNIGGLVAYLCVSGLDPESFFGILCTPCSNLKFVDQETVSEIVQPVSFVSLFTLSYGAIPVLCEARNMVYSILAIIGTHKLGEKFIQSVNSVTETKYQ